MHAYVKVRALNRQKWLQLLIRIAGSRYVLTEPTPKGGKGEAKGDVGGFAGTLTIPEAFERLLRQDMAKVPSLSLNPTLTLTVQPSPLNPHRSTLNPHH